MRITFYRDPVRCRKCGFSLKASTEIRKFYDPAHFPDGGFAATLGGES